MDNNLKSQNKTCLQAQQIDQLNEQRNQTTHELPKFQIQDISVYEKKDELKNNKIESKLYYKLLKSQRFDQKCLAIAFNTKGNVLFVAYSKTIIVYFNCQITKMLQKLVNHTDDIYCLYSMKNHNSFVSGSKDSSIIIWKFDQLNKWSIIAKLQDHNSYVLCILMNKNEDLLISGSRDQTVKFWKKNDNQWICQQTIDLKDYSCSLSLNEQEVNLISCGKQSFIKVMQMNQEKIWSIVQTIDVDQNGFRLYFFNYKQFVFQPKTKDFIEIYYFDNQVRQFKKHKQIQIQSCEYCDWFFPIQFIKDLKILTVKHGQFLNLFRVQDDVDIIHIQAIDLNDYRLYGNLTDDGKYLATWDSGSKQVKIKQLRSFD